MTSPGRRAVTLLTIVLLLPAAAFASGLARRVADLNPGTWTEPWGEVCVEIGPGAHVAEWPGLLFADLRGEGCEVFAVDAIQGTVAWSSGVGEVGARLTRVFGRAGELVYFEAETRAAGCELWRTDGTPAGTSMLPERFPGPQATGWWEWFVASEPWSYFPRHDQVTGTELWRTDGTAAGTGRVLDLRPGPESGVDDRPGVAANGFVFFVADDGVHGAELWRSDGSEAGTFAVTELNRETTVRDLSAAGPHALLTTFDGRFHLWSSDGSAEGAVRLWSSAVGDEVTTYPIASGTRAMFAVDRDELWVTDGTAAGTARVALLEFDLDFEDALRPFGDSWLFAGYDPLHGGEPWVSDGTAAGTRLLLDVDPGSASSTIGELSSAPYGDGLLLTLADGVHWIELWYTEGTAESTRRLTDLEPAEAGEQIVPLGEEDGRGLFLVGRELWRTNGTSAGTGPIAAIGGDRSPSRPRRLFDVGELLYFVAKQEAANPSRAGRSDGSETGTFLLPEEVGVADVYFSRLDDGTLIANSNLGEHSQFWSSSGTDVVLLTTYAEGCGGHGTCGLEQPLPSAGPRALYEEGGELGATDGTIAGTGIWLDLPEDSFPRAFVQAGNEAWFAASTGVSGADQIWRSAGTVATTLPILDLPEGSGENRAVRQLLPMDPESGRLFLRWSVPFDSDELWYGPGVGATPVLLRDDIDHVESLGVVGGRMLLRFWGAPSSGVGFEPWVSDGTVAGTELLADVWPGVVGSDPRPGVEVTGRLVFPACDPDHGCEPWVSDGTAAGTSLLADLQPGPGSSSPAGLARIGEHVYFSACRTGSGCEAWVTDGTAAGTFELATIERGPASTLPRDRYYLVSGDSEEPAFVEHGGEIYFAGDDGTGAELWAMPVLVFYDGFETGDTSRWSAP